MEGFLAKSMVEDRARRIWGDLLRSVSGEVTRGDCGDVEPMSSKEGRVRNVPRRSVAEALTLTEPPVEAEVTDSVRVARIVDLVPRVAAEFSTELGIVVRTFFRVQLVDHISSGS